MRGLCLPNKADSGTGLMEDDGVDDAAWVLHESDSILSQGVKDERKSLRDTGLD